MIRPRRAPALHRAMICLAAWASLLSCGGGGKADPKRPNIILITLDTTRADRLGCYGSTRGLTPNLDRLAAEGAVFTRACAQAAVTPVTHASIFTGLNPYSHGLRALHGMKENRLPERTVTLAECLRAVGYQTAAFVSAFPVTTFFGLNQGFDTFDSQFMVDEASKLMDAKGVVTTDLNQRDAGTTTAAATRWLDERKSGPYLLWVHYFDPHDPAMLPPADWLKGIDTTLPPRPLCLAYYDREVQYMDHHIGELVKKIGAESGPNTHIIVVADHGEGLGDHNWWTHGILYNEQIHVPLIMKGPGIPAGARVGTTVRSMDIMPTVLELTGSPVRESLYMEAESLIPLLGAPDAPHRTAYADSVSGITYGTPDSQENKQEDKLFSLIEFPWKYIHHHTHPENSELYNLETDWGELTNRVTTEPEVSTRLRASLDALDYTRTRFAQSEQMAPEDMERLRQLGYMN